MTKTALTRNSDRKVHEERPVPIGTAWWNCLRPMNLNRSLKAKGGRNGSTARPRDGSIERVRFRCGQRISQLVLAKRGISSLNSTL
jgi:hypothetical protein